MQDFKQTEVDSLNCTIKARGWRRSTGSLVHSDKFHHNYKRDSPLIEPQYLSYEIEVEPMDCIFESTRLELDSESSRLLRRHNSSNRLTPVAPCARSSSSLLLPSTSPSSLSSLAAAVISPATSAFFDQKLRRRLRRAIIPPATCPLLAISILLSILSLSLAAVSFATAPAENFQQTLAGQLPFAFVQPGDARKQWATGQLELLATPKRIISERSSIDQVSSADLPAEFRDNDEGVPVGSNDAGNETANEQSKLAKLCQQTSSVLASVLPAPFGGHKRSILCQFFGQVPFARKQANSKVAKQQQQQQHQQQQHLLFQHQQQQVPHYETADNAVALIQSQQPVSILGANGRHPIEIVLEQQQRQHNQMLLANSRLANMDRLRANLAQDTMQASDLKSSASVIDYAYQQKVEPPLSMRQAKGLPVSVNKLAQSMTTKFSRPLASTSFKPPSSLQITSRPMSTSGWRIFNHTVDSTSPQPPVPSTTVSPVVPVKVKVNTTSRAHKPDTMTDTSGIVESLQQQVDSRDIFKPSLGKIHSHEAGASAKISIQNQTVPPRHSAPVWSESLNIGSAQLLVMGKPPGFSQAANERQLNSTNAIATAVAEDQQQVNIGKRSEALKSTTRFADISKSDSNLSEVRTIEVVAQNSNNNNHNHFSASSAGSTNPGKTLGGSSSTISSLVSGNTTQKPAADLRQVQKREELVIASINNLTRIAFGNQLRDTVKVINKLIDQHSDLFNVQNKAAAGIDPMLTSESGRQQIVNGSNFKAKKGAQSKNSDQLSNETGSKASSIGGDLSGSGETATTNSKSRQKQILLPIGDKTSARSGQSKPAKKAKKQSIPAASSARILQQSSEAHKQATPESVSVTFSGQKVATNTPMKAFAKETLKEDTSKHSASDRSASGRHGERKSSASQLGDLQRLHGHTVSRALTFASSSMKPSRTTKPADFDLPIPAVTLDDIHRDKTPWKLANSQSATTRAVPSSRSSSMALASRLDRKPANSVTNFPWLLPDKSVYHSDLFGGLSTTGTDERKPLTGVEALKRWTTKKAPVQFGAGMSGKQALVLNRLDNTKLDSLTTLKMALSAQSATTAEPPSWSAFQKSSSSTQSRWIPTSTVTKPSSTTTTSTTTTTTTTSTSTTTTTTTTPAPTTARRETETETEAETVQTTVAMPSTSTTLARESLTQNDLNEARASDSISRYTTHWNEANELLATTHKRFSQQPMPQIAQTGEYFSAETISSWPERYQTMLESAKPATTPSFGETTRRNGEAYDNQLGNTRHRLPTNADSLSSALDTRTTRSELVTPLSGVTILPANHKLTTTTQQLNDGAKSLANFETNSKQIQTLSSPAYTLVGPHTSDNVGELPESTEQQQQPSNENVLVEEAASGKFPRLMDDIYVAAGTDAGAATVGLSGLKPPYSEQHEGEPLESDRDAILTLYNQSTLSKPQVSRKLYEMLVPSTRSFVGPQSPLNQQRFNLSALKFLAQNLLASPKGHRGSLNESIANIHEEAAIKGLSNNTTSQKLLDMLDVSLASNYQDMLSNDTDSFKNSSISDGSNRSILGRASNLLNDLRQLEQKKAAAILAAIRYQVPSPLVRPWDLATDGHVVSELAGARDRLDSGQLGDSIDKDYGRDSFVLGQVSNAIKSAIFKQRLIPRSELEARLKLGHDSSALRPLEVNPGKEGSERRSDSDLTNPKTGPRDSLSYSLDDNYNVMHDIGKNDEILEEYLLANDKTQPTKLSARNLLPSAKNWLEKFLLSGSSQNLTSQNRSIAAGDYDLIDLSASTKTPNLDENEPLATRYPKYIRLTDYKTAWSSPKATEPRLQSLLQKQNLPSAAVAARLRTILALARANSTSENQDEEVETKESKTNSDIRTIGNAGQQVEKKDNKFDCLDRQAGFYPDTDSTCQTFYHCSSTGHLLTFSCPQQTRFDERSLKCGPWYEVPCDLGRIKQRRLHA